MLPIPRHTALDAYPYATGFAVHRDPETGKLNQMYPRSGVLSRTEMVTSYVTPTANQNPRQTPGRRDAHAPGHCNRCPSGLGVGRLLFPPARRLVGS